MTDITTDINIILPGAIARTANADLSVTGRSGVLGASQTSDCAQAGAMGTIGIIGAVDQNNNNGAEAYAEYLQANKEVGSTGDAVGEEISIINSSGQNVIETPENPNPVGATRGLRIDAGRPDEVSGPVSVALDIETNSTVAGVGFNNGIISGQGAILGDSQGNAMFSKIAPGQSYGWSKADGSDGPLFRSDCVTGTPLIFIFGNDGSFNVQSKGANVFTVKVDASNHACVYVNGNKIAG